MEGLVAGEYAPLTKRGISEETCKHFGYQFGEFKGKPVQIANYRNADGEIVAQKLRFANKEFTAVGVMKDALPLYGQWLWRDGGKMVVVTEGEIDAMSVSQLQGNKWPVVSVKSGAQGGQQNVAAALEWLEKFETVVFMLDMDEPGRVAARECALTLTPGKAKIAVLPEPFKDASDMLQAGRGKELIDAIWSAKVYRPEGIVTFDDIKGKMLKAIEVGLPWFLPELTELTYGRRYGEVHTIGAGTGIGKTDFYVQQMAYDLTVLHQSIGVFSYEQEPYETGQRIAGKFAGKLYHLPGWEPEELDAVIDQIKALATPYFFDHFGTADWDDTEKRIRFLTRSCGVRIFYVDNLTALVSGEHTSEKEGLERIMARIGGLVKELNILIMLVSHLATPEGTSHEEGGRVTIRHFKGARAVGFWSHCMYGLERDQQAEDEREQTSTTLRILKYRPFGRAVGKTLSLGYDATAGRYHMATPFEDETHNSESEF